MDPTLIALVVKLLQIAVQYGPELAAEFEMTIALLRQDTPLTDAQIKQVEDALDKASAALDAAIAARLGAGS